MTDDLDDKYLGMVRDWQRAQQPKKKPDLRMVVLPLYRMRALPPPFKMTEEDKRGLER